MIENTFTRCRPLLGTFVEITLKGYDNKDRLIDLSTMLFDEIERIHSLLGFHNLDSELTHLNQRMLTTTLDNFPISVDMNNVLTLALSLHRESNGLFDVAIASHLIKQNLLPDHSLNFPDQLGTSNNLSLNDQRLSTNAPLCIDLGGIAKGYAVDCAMNTLLRLTFENSIKCTINAGGDLRSNDWENEVVHLKYAKRANALKKTKMTQTAVATSGTYLQSNHQDKTSAIVNPIQNKPHQFKGCVSVFSGSTMISDALTKAVILMPKKEIKILLRAYNAQAIITNRFGFSRTIN